MNTDTIGGAPPTATAPVLNKSRLAKDLGVSRGSLYYKHKLPLKDDILRREIEAVMTANPGYGSPRVAIALKINDKRAARVMKLFSLKPARRSIKTPYKPDDVGLLAQKKPCILSHLSPIAPNVVWVSDFTFIPFQGHFIYLCTVLDAFTGEVLGFNISRRHDASFVKLAIERAILKTGGSIPTWFHSDQGSEYASITISEWLENMGVIISMNPKGSPWCNGLQESFYGRFKVEFGDVSRFETLADLLEALYEHLYYFSNERIKTKLKMSPAEFRIQWEINHSELLISLSSTGNPQISTRYQSPPLKPPRCCPSGAEYTTTTN